MAGSFKIRLYLLIPVPKIWICIVTSVALLKIIKAKHRSHVAFTVAVHSRNAYEIFSIIKVIAHSSKKYVSEIIIAMQQEAVSRDINFILVKTL